MIGNNEFSAFSIMNGDMASMDWAYRMSLIRNEWIIVEQEPPHDKDIWVKVVVSIQKEETGEVKTYEDVLIWDDGKPFTFIWEEGNFKCDCNRSNFFGDEEAECGESKYSVNIQNAKNMEYIYKEF